MATSAGSSSEKLTTAQNPSSSHVYALTWVAMSAFFVILFFNVGAANPPRAQLPVYVESELAAAPIVTSIVQSTFHIVFAAMLLVGGFLADRFRPKRTFIIGLLTPAVAGFLLIAQEVWLLVLVAALTGTFFALHAAGSRAYLVLAVPLKRMGLLGNLYELGFTLGAALGNAAVGFIAARSGFQLAGAIIVVMGLVTAVAAQIWLPTVAPKNVSAAPVTLGSYWQLAQRRSVQLLLLLRGLPTIYWATGQLVIGIQLLRLTGSPVAPALFYAVSLLAIGTTMMPVGWAADRWGSGLPVLVSTVLVITGSVLAAILVNNAWGLVCGAFVGHLGAWWLSGLFPLLVAESGTHDEQGRLVAVTEMAWNIGAVVGALGAGALLTVHLSAPFLMAAWLNIPTLLIAMLVAAGGHRAVRAEPVAALETG